MAYNKNKKIIINLRDRFFMSWFERLNAAWTTGELGWSQPPPPPPPPDIAIPDHTFGFKNEDIDNLIAQEIPLVIVLVAIFTAGIIAWHIGGCIGSLFRSITNVIWFILRVSITIVIVATVAMVAIPEEYRVQVYSASRAIINEFLKKGAFSLIAIAYRLYLGSANLFVAAHGMWQDKNNS